MVGSLMPFRHQIIVDSLSNEKDATILARAIATGGKFIRVSVSFATSSLYVDTSKRKLTELEEGILRKACEVVGASYRTEADAWRVSRERRR